MSPPIRRRARPISTTTKPRWSRPVRSPDRLLDVRGLCAGYGGGLVLNRLSLHVARGEVVGLLGRNGAGRSTLIKAVLGGVAISAGSIAFAGCDVTGWRPDRVA